MRPSPRQSAALGIFIAIHSPIKRFIRLLIGAGKNWNRDQATTLSAALAYYTAFSLAPLLLITIGIVGLFFGQRTGTHEIYATIEKLLGPSGAKSIESLLHSVGSHPGHSRVAALIGAATLLVGASGVFVQIQQSLDWIWRVQGRSDRTIASFLRQRLISFSMVAVLGFILLVSLLMTAAISALEKFAMRELPLHNGTLWHLINTGISLGISALLFAMVYKVLPDVKLTFRDVRSGALLTSILFSLGKTAIGLYLGHSAIASSYGAAGSFVLVLVWIYYSSFIFYFGAEFTRVSIIASRKTVKCKNLAEPIPGYEDLFQIPPAA